MWQLLLQWRSTLSLVDWVTATALPRLGIQLLLSGWTLLPQRPVSWLLMSWLSSPASVLVTSFSAAPAVITLASLAVGLATAAATDSAAAAAVLGADTTNWHEA